MRATKTAVFIIGILALIIGLVWIGQGTGYFPYPANSFMINQSPWVLRGAILAIIGGIAIIWSRRR
jgi:hypothetical protein